MGDEEKGTTFDKGDRAAIVGGRKGVGVRGEVFWIGENKYGSGSRYGLRGDDGDTYWIDETHLGPEGDAPPTPEYEAKPVLEKGTHVAIVKGSDAGKEGEIFWVGDSKFGPGMRYGVRGDDAETYWADERQIEVREAPAKKASAPSKAGPADDAPFPSDDFDEAPRDDFDAPFDDGGKPVTGADDFDAPFPDDDVPF